MNQFPDVLTPKEVAAVLRVSVRHVQNEAVSLGGFKVGNQWRFNADRIMSVIQGQGCSDASHNGAGLPNSRSGNDNASSYAALLSGTKFAHAQQRCN